MTTKKLKEVLDRLVTWPEAVQDEAADTLLAMEAERLGGIELSAADRDALERSADDVREGRFASEPQVEAVLAKYRRP